jgi:hypothetical protein
MEGHCNLDKRLGWNNIICPNYKEVEEIFTIKDRRRLYYINKHSKDYTFILLII